MRISKALNNASESGEHKEGGPSQIVVVIVVSVIAVIAGMVFLRFGSRPLYDALVSSASFWFLLFVMVFTAATSSMDSKSMKTVRKFLTALLVVCILFEGFHLVPDVWRHWGEKVVILTHKDPSFHVIIKPYYRIDSWYDTAKVKTSVEKDGDYLRKSFTKRSRVGDDTIIYVIKKGPRRY